MESLPGKGVVGKEPFLGRVFEDLRTIQLAELLNVDRPPKSVNLVVAMMVKGHHLWQFVEFVVPERIDLLPLPPLDVGTKELCSQCLVPLPCL